MKLCLILTYGTKPIIKSAYTGYLETKQRDSMKDSFITDVLNFMSSFNSRKTTEYKLHCLANGNNCYTILMLKSKGSLHGI